MPTSWISTVKNLDLLDRDRFPDADSEPGDAPRAWPSDWHTPLEPLVFSAGCRLIPDHSREPTLL
jgi:hypothetical protein